MSLSVLPVSDAKRKNPDTMGIALRRYIEAIESRLHRMEVLLGGLLGSDDPRAQTLLGELIGTCAATRPRSFDKKVPGETDTQS